YYTNGEVSGDLAEEVMAFINNVANNTKSIITPKEAYDSLRGVDAIERSIAEGKEVSL
ncbi:gfo/Idh/MocA family oxidoreductase, partial [Escherichia coli]|nr:gfo/Idh/MocA family oxidoreductase [Escherichia coli]